MTNLRAKLKEGQKLIVIFGSAGLRDTSKRPLMGAVAAQLADKIILTSEDPRFENPRNIAKEIMSGIPTAKRQDVVIELDRAKAIDYAINQLARKGDWIIACGKGHEESMNLDGFTETPWSDHEAFLSSLNNKP